MIIPCEYEEIYRCPAFSKSDRFQMNIVSCAMLEAVVLSMPERPEVGTLTEYYCNSMMTNAMKWFCRMCDRQKFTTKDIDGMKI